MNTVAVNDLVLKSEFHPLAGKRLILKKRGKTKSKVLVFGMETTIPNIYLDLPPLT